MILSNSRWIWRDDKPDAENQYVCFRREFTLARVFPKSVLTLAADSDCQVFVNGVEVYGRPFSDYPRHRSYDGYPVGALLRRGRNVITLLGYFRGRDSSEYRKGRPGLIACLKAGPVEIRTDSSWRCRLSRLYASGPLPSVTVQMGITVRADARREDEWTSFSYKMGRDWTPAVELAGATDGYWTRLTPRVLPQMARGAFQRGRPIALGELKRPPAAADLEPALAMADDFKRLRRTVPSQDYPFEFKPSSEKGAGAAVIVDMGAETLGLLRFEIEAPAGTIVDVAHGEHLEDMGVRPAPGSRRFADRFICRSGRQVFEIPFRRLGCRYLELHILDFRSPVTLHAAGLYPLRYPVRETGSFASADTALGDIRETAVRTLSLCMGDHYFDCPWREQSLYAYDSRNQALYGYYAFGEYAFPKQSFRLLGWGKRDDGLLELCAPARVPITIPIFSLAWICELQEHGLFSGDDTLFREFEPTIRSILAAFLSRRDESTGLYGLFEEKGIWTFYEWIDGLDSRKEGQFRLDLPHNLYLAEAMEAYAAMLDWAGRGSEAVPWRRRTADLKRRMQAVFWDPERAAYATYADRRKRWHFAAGVQALALCNSLGTAAMRRSLQSRLHTDPSFIPMTLQVLGYGCQAMLDAPADGQVAVLNRIRRTFGGMLKQGATSLYEIDNLYHDDFAIAGSYCHAWSSVPIWLQQAYILGVRPLEPGFRRFVVNPHPCGLPAASGTIPTPHGPISVQWEINRAGRRIDIKCPRPLVPVLRTSPSFGKRAVVSIKPL